MPKVFLRNTFDLKPSTKIEFTQPEIRALKHFDGSIQDLITVDCFSRLKQGNSLYNCNYYDSEQKHCSSYAKWEYNGITQYGLIVKFIRVKDKESLIAMKFRILNFHESLNISSRYERAFNICKLDKYFAIVSNNDFSYVCLSVTCLKANCIFVQIPTMSFGMMTDVFDFEHD